MSLETLFEEIQVWQRETFPRATALSAANHLVREAKELLEDPSELSELADVIILAVGVADQLGIDIEEVVRIKLEINKERVWGEPDEDGVVEHVPRNYMNLDSNGSPYTISNTRMKLDGELPG
jgi:hypothetical protein